MGWDGVRPVILFRSDVVARPLIVILVTVTVAVCVLNAAGALVAPPVREPLLSTALLVFLIDGLAIANFYKLVVTFDGREVVFRFGLFRKSIPLAVIAGAEAVDIKWFSFGGLGIHFSSRGWAWLAASGPGIAVKTAGKTYYANVDRPAVLVNMIDDYRRAAGLSR